MSRPRILLLLLLLFCGTTAATEARAAKLKVPSQFATIQDAVNAAQPGDVIEVSAGTYPEHVVVSGKSDLVLRARKGHKVWVDGQSTGVPLTIQGSSNVRVEKIRFRNSNAEGVRLNTSINAALVGCRILDAAANGVFVTNCFPARIEKCVIENPGAFGVGILSEGVEVVDCVITGAATSGVAVLGDQCVVADNRIESPALDGVQLGDGSVPCRYTLVTGNTITSPGQRGIRVTASVEVALVSENDVGGAGSSGVFVGNGAVGAVVAKNTVHGCEKGIEVDTSGGLLKSNSVKKSADDGIVVGMNALDYVVRKNKVKKAGAIGLNVLGGSHVFVRNVVTKSGTFDLSDAANPGANAYVENVFGTIAP